jgi:S-methylmethionine-dependent homocysteine/selenocysteine methylase
VAVFHVDAKHNDFIGEGCAVVDTFEHAQDIKLNFEQPLTQQLSRQAYTLLGVLAARRSDEGWFDEGEGWWRSCCVLVVSLRNGIA